GPGDVRGGGAASLPGERAVDRPAEQDRGQHHRRVHDDASQRAERELARDLTKVAAHLPEIGEHRGRYFTKTQAGCSSGDATRPIAAGVAMSSGLLTFQRNSTARLTSATSAVSQSPIAMRPSRTQAPRIVPIAAAYAPRMKPCTLGFVRYRTRTGATIRTSRNDGRKMPIVATSEPQKPATR